MKTVSSILLWIALACWQPSCNNPQPVVEAHQNMTKRKAAEVKNCLMGRLDSWRMNNQRILTTESFTEGNILLLAVAGEGCEYRYQWIYWNVLSAELMHDDANNRPEIVIMLDKRDIWEGYASEIVWPLISIDGSTGNIAIWSCAGC